MAITRMQNCYYVAEDVARARAFYERTLGLTVKFADRDRWVQFSVGGANFALASPAEGGSGLSGGVIVLEVDDLAALRPRLEADGTKILGERDMGSHGQTMTIADPAGNVLQLFQKARPATVAGQPGS